MSKANRSWWAGILLFAPTGGAGSGGTTVKVGSEFQLNVYTTQSQQQPAIDVAANGSFVVIWRVFGRRFSSPGSALGGELLIGTYTAGWQHAPALAMEADGDFGVVRRSYLGRSTSSPTTAPKALSSREDSRSRSLASTESD